MLKVVSSIVGLIICFALRAQLESSDIYPISIDDDGNYSGYEALVQNNDIRLFALGEHWHNIKSVPKATFKLLKFLNENANVTVLAIEQGKSVAWMINSYLRSGDENMLSHITRNTMFWGKEHREFFRDLRNFNLQVSQEKQITVESIDIEYKMESAVFVINELIESKPLPEELNSTVGEFKRVYEETKVERESYDGIAVFFYYDRDFIQGLVIRTLADLEERSENYIDFFEDDFTTFATMILEMDDGLTFDYTNANQNYKFRDRIIYKNFIDLKDQYPNAGILCPIGMRHVENGSSLANLSNKPNSPFFNEVAIIRISALYNKAINAGDLKKINFNYPKQLKTNSATLIYHNPENSFLKSKKYDYTVFINENGSLTRFENILTER